MAPSLFYKFRFTELILNSIGKTYGLFIIIGCAYMSIQKKYLEKDFIEVWGRINNETEIQSLSKLASLLGITQPSVSERKKRGKFPIEWAYIIGMQYNLSTDWILTGEGPKRKYEEPKKKFLLLIDQWLCEITQNDPGREEWFKYHFIDAFPKFDTWARRKELK
jgi:hypothetical protein